MAKTVYFLGIGGIGMSALARFFMQRGDEVHGYDHVQTAITDQLRQEGAHIHFDEDLAAIPANVDFVVYTPAIPANHLEYRHFLEKGIPVYKRSQVLGMLAKGHPTIAIAGTHGKTTTTAMVTQMLRTSRELLAFIGGIAKNINSNFLISKDFDTVVAEADEFDRSFLTLFPTLAVITSMDADHLDIYGDRQHLVESFQLFANQIDKDGYLLIHEHIADQISHPRKLTYGEGEACNFRISDINLQASRAHFSLTHNDICHRDICIGVSGRHNVLNAAAALAIGLLLEVPEELLRTQLADFSGVKRRFDYQIDREDLVFIDDYAHHPEEIRSIVNAVRSIYPGKELTVVFQPHLYTRTRDFGSEFAQVLATADRVILLDIYPARELPIEGITSQWLLGMIENPRKVLLTKAQLVSYLTDNKTDIILTVGAGDIDKLVPEIRAALK